MHTPLSELFSEEGCREGEILVDTKGLQELIARQLRLGRFNEVHGVLGADERLLKEAEKCWAKSAEVMERAVAAYLKRGYSQQRVGEILRLKLDQVKLLASRVGEKK